MPGDNKILLIEDSLTDGAIFKQVMRVSGLENEVILVTSGEDALEYFKGAGRYADREAFPMPKVVFVDLVLAGDLSGYDVIPKLKEVAPNLIAVAVSQWDDAEAVRTAYSVGANCYISKPVRPGDLLNVAEHYKQFW